MIGPELGFGWQVANTFDENVLIIKTCWGGKSLKTDFRSERIGDAERDELVRIQLALSF